MNELLGARRVRELLEEHGVRPTKSLGQNFVIDPNTIRKVLEVAALELDATVLEIGAGAGSLTVGLAGAASRVIAVEVDPRLVAVVTEVTAGLDNVEVVAADALALDYAGIEATDVVANLPYNLAATVVIDVLQRAPLVRRMTVMTQREVAERLAATPGSKLYGLTSVLVAFHGAARVAGSVSRRAFFPVPNVDSAIVRIERRAAPDVDAVLFAAVARAAFSQRRKMMRNPLATMVGSPDQTAAVMESAAIEPTARAEQLGVEDFVRLTRAFAEISGSRP